MKPKPRIPLALWKQGQVLRLKEPLSGIREGWFVFQGLSGVTFTIRRLGEDSAGNLCATEEVHQVHMDFADSFTPAMSISGSV